MLSNKNIKTLSKEKNYLLQALKAEGKYLSPSGMKFLNKELSKVNAKIKEAEGREYVGKTESEKLVYIADSEWQSVCEKCLYIEELGSGWDVNSFDLTSGSQFDVVVDGGQDWSETIIIS